MRRLINFLTTLGKRVKEDMEIVIEDEHFMVRSGGEEYKYEFENIFEKKLIEMMFGSGQQKKRRKRKVKEDVPEAEV